MAGNHVMVCALAFLTYAIAGSSAAQSPSSPDLPVAIHLRTEQVLPKVGGEKSHRDALRVSQGDSVQMVVEVEFEDGTRKIVTTDPATQYFATGGKLAAVSETGEVAFAVGESAYEEIVGIMASYKNQVGILLFFVSR